eukprot:snap_masked-scaffold_8-processed-gene-3.40-mRNA-1 protein AED:0.19 eAED:1.00 QI:0/0/0/1/1/1/2/0/150
MNIKINVAFTFLLSLSWISSAARLVEDCQESGCPPGNLCMEELDGNSTCVTVSCEDPFACGEFEDCLPFDPPADCVFCEQFTCEPQECIECIDSVDAQGCGCWYTNSSCYDCGLETCTACLPPYFCCNKKKKAEEIQEEERAEVYVKLQI